MPESNQPAPRPSPPPSRRLALLLAALSSLGPFSIDTYLPAFHAIEGSLQASPLAVQQTLSAYLIAFALMTLWHGALADRFGRRRVILGALALFALASAGCASAQSIDLLWCWRALQGVTAGAGIVVSRAIVRDLYDGPAAQRLMSQITMMFALAPAIAPIVGGLLQAAFGWRAIFVFLSLSTVGLALAVWRDLPETLPLERRRPLHPTYLMQAYAHVLSSPRFLTACGALACNFLGFFIYVLAAPAFLMRHLGVGETEFIWLFGPAMSGMVLGAWLSGRLAGRRSPAFCIGLGYTLMGSAAVSNLAGNLLATASLPWAVLPLFLYTLGMSISMPCLSLLALDPFPEKRGLAASCQTFIQSSSNSLGAGIIVPLIWGSLLHLATGMAALLLLGGLIYGLHRRRTPAQD